MVKNPCSRQAESIAAATAARSPRPSTRAETSMTGSASAAMAGPYAFRDVEEDATCSDRARDDGSTGGHRAPASRFLGHGNRGRGIGRAELVPRARAADHSGRDRAFGGDRPELEDVAGFRLGHSHGTQVAGPVGQEHHAGGPETIIRS